MRYTTHQVDSARSKVTDMECRIADQQRLVSDLVAKGYPFADGRTQLAIMEQSLIQIRTFVQNLENRHIADQARPQQCSAKADRPSVPVRDIESSSDIDILEVAEAVVHQYGNRGPLFCARKMVDMLERGDLNRVATWLAIRHATQSLLEE